MIRSGAAQRERTPRRRDGEWYQIGWLGRLEGREHAHGPSNGAAVIGTCRTGSATRFLLVPGYRRG
jgi:hypothetical protein